VRKLFELIRWIWIEVQLSSPLPVQKRIIPYLHKAKDTVRLLLKPYLTVYQWRGRNEGGPLTVSYAGLGYAASFLKSILFMEEPTVTEVKKVPIWQPGGLANSPGSDIVVIEATKRLVRKLPGKNAITLPFHVGLVLDVRGSWEEVKCRLRRDARRNDLRTVKKYGYDYDVSHNDQDLDMFYHTIYLPTLKARYPKLASPMSVQEAHQYFRHGQLFLIKRDGQYVSGALCTVHHDGVIRRSLGVMNAEERLIREGAQVATHYASIHWANRQGYKWVDFGGCWPYIEGVFLYKRKWGSAASVWPESENRQIWIKIQRDTSAVSQFLKDNPCVVVDNEGKLRVLVVPDDPDSVTSETETRWHKQYAMPGLSGFLVRSVKDLVDN